VLDTHVLMDWWVFGGAIGPALEAALSTRRVRWLATEAMRGELAHVLARGIPGWPVDATRWQTGWARWAECVAPPSASLALPRCSDPDDQKFIDLAVGVGARWLLSRDKAVLKLARRLQRYGVVVCTPERWLAEAGAP
jgi:predicted nucleic acid-binding protein